MSQSIDPRFPRSLPAPNQRAAWREYWLQGLGEREEAGVRKWLIEFGGLNDRLVDVLLAEFAMREISRHPWEERRQRGTRWNRWSSEVMRIRVDVHPGGRVLMHREGDDTFLALLGFRFVGKHEGRDTWRPSRLEFSGINTEISTLDTSIYWAAFILEMQRTHVPRPKGLFGVPRPQPGKAPSLEWYEALHAEHDVLVAEGHPAPAKELAERHGYNRATMRTQISKARELRSQRARGIEATAKKGKTR